MTKKTDRRSFVKAAASVPLVSQLSYSMSAFGNEQSITNYTKENFPRGYMKATDRNLDLDLELVEGEIPAGIKGHVFTMESAPTKEKVNLAAGRGMICRFNLSEEKISLTRRKLNTPSAKAFDYFQTGRQRFKKFGLAYLSNRLGPANFCNTAFTKLADGRLAISYDGGRPFEIDPISLDVVTPIGARTEWRSALPKIAGIISTSWTFDLNRATAHPFYDQNTAEFFSVNFDTTLNTGLGNFGASFLDLVVWNLDGKLRKHRILDKNGRRIVIKEAVHSICVTKNFILIFDTPFALEVEQLLGGNVTRPPAFQTPCYIIERRQLKKNGNTLRAATVTLTKEWEHVFALYDDDGQNLRFMGASSPATDFSESLTEGDRYRDGSKVPSDLHGMIAGALDEGEYGVFDVSVKGTNAELQEFTEVSALDRGWLIALPSLKEDTAGKLDASESYWTSFGYQPELISQRVFNSLKDYPHRKVATRDLPEAPTPSALQRVDVESASVVDSYDAPLGWILTSPLYIPSKNLSGEHANAHVLVIANSNPTDNVSTGCEIWIFEANNLSAGPVCRLTHPELILGFSLHSCYLEKLMTNQATQNYRTSFANDYSKSLSFHPRFVEKFFEEHIFTMSE